jgi:hypothetical protein
MEFPNRSDVGGRSSMRTPHWRRYRQFNDMEMVFPDQSPLRGSVWFNHIYLLASRFTQAVVLG